MSPSSRSPALFLLPLQHLQHPHPPPLGTALRAHSEAAAGAAGYLSVSLSMNRLVKSFTCATRSPKGFTLRATLSEVSRTKNRSTGQSGGRQSGVAWHYPPLAMPQLPPGTPAGRALGGDSVAVLTPRKTHEHACMGRIILSQHFCFGINGELDCI